MARRGRFGRRRSGGADMTALIAQLIAKQRAEEDQAMFDAWRNGGLVDGEPVDDKRILAYIKQRRDSFSKTDPLYDQWNNRLIQTEFTVGEQKIGLAFKEGRVSAGAVASWYRGQLSKFPKDSQAYRDIAGRAADWAKSAAASARAGARKKISDAINDKLRAEGEKWLQWQELNAVVENAARQAGVIAGTMTLTDGKAELVQALFERGVYLGDQQITFAEYRQAALAHAGVLDRVIQLYRQDERAASTIAEAEAQKRDFFDQTIVRLNVVDDRAKYEMARAEWEKALGIGTERPVTNPFEIMRINARFANTLEKIAERAESAEGFEQNDPEFIGAVRNEIAAVTTGEANGPTVSDLQGSTGEGVSLSDVTDTAQSTALVLDQLDRIKRGDSYLGQQEPGGPLMVIDYPPSKDVDVTGRNGLDPSVQPQFATIDGVTTTVMLKGAPVYAAVAQDREGNLVDPSRLGDPAFVNDQYRRGELLAQTENATLVGYVFTDTNQKQFYGVMSPDGSLAFTRQNPFSRGLIPAEGQYISLTAVDPESIIPGEGFAPDLSGVIAALSATGEPGKIGVTPIMTDSSIAPKDLLKALEGLEDQLDPDTLEAYRQKLLTEDFRRQQRADNPPPVDPSVRRGFVGPPSMRELGEDEERNPLLGIVPPFLSNAIVTTIDTLGQAIKANLLPQEEKDPLAGIRKQSAPQLAVTPPKPGEPPKPDIDIEPEEEDFELPTSYTPPTSSGGGAKNKPIAL